jgi:hypothetical protein
MTGRLSSLFKHFWRAFVVYSPRPSNGRLRCIDVLDAALKEYAQGVTIDDASDAEE